jgi:hypothetical protein
LIEEPLLAATRLARAAAEEAIPLGQASADAIADVLEKRIAVLCSIDKKFCVEKYFFLSVIGAGAVNRLVAEVGRCLPTEASPKTIEEVMAGLDRLGQTKLIEFCGLGLQGAFRSAKEFIASIKAGRAPNYSGGDRDSLLTKLVMDSSAFWLTDEVAATATGAAVTLRGGKAALAKFKAISASMSENVDVTLKDLTPLAVFSWLLTQQQNDQIKGWTDVIIKADVMKAASTSAAASVAKKRTLFRGRPKNLDPKSLVISLSKND